MISRAKLQFALDDANMTIPEAVAFVQNGLLEQIDILEYGTPLFYRWGLEGLRLLRNAFPKKTLTADLKLVDGVARLIPMAAKSGADCVTVSIRAAEEVIQQAIQTAHALNLEVMVDLSYAENICAAMRLCRTLGADSVCYGREPQPDGSFRDTGLNIILQEKGPVSLAYAGDLRLENISEIVSCYHPEIVICARGIAREQDPVLTAQRMKQLLDNGRFEQN